MVKDINRHRLSCRSICWPTMCVISCCLASTVNHVGFDISHVGGGGSGWG